MFEFFSPCFLLRIFAMLCQYPWLQFNLSRLILVHQIYAIECTCRIYAESYQQKPSVCDAEVYESIMVSEVIQAFREVWQWEIFWRLAQVCKGDFFAQRRCLRVWTGWEKPCCVRSLYIQAFWLHLKSTSGILVGLIFWRMIVVRVYYYIVSIILRGFVSPVVLCRPWIVRYEF